MALLVSLAVIRDVTHVSAGVTVVFKGHAELRWSERVGTGKNRHTRWYSAEETYFQDTHFFLGGPSGNKALLH